MVFIPSINIINYDYELPEERIAQFPLDQRDESRLLIYQNGNLTKDRFYNLPDYLPDNCLLIRNETKVIRARLLFKKESGAPIELFCLEPVSPTKELQQAFEQKSPVVWRCLVGNSRRWKSGKLFKKLDSGGTAFNFMAERIEQFPDHSLIRFEWDSPLLSFSEIVLLAGIIPLPPYMNRETVDSDAERYQTIYARTEGSVAAPTAGLHFTDSVIEKLKSKNISIEEVTLHVGAGTFKPVGKEDVRDHVMHAENITISKKTIQKILKKINEPIIIVGTTSMRTIESLYWFGIKLLVDKKPTREININQWDPYDPIYNCGIPANKSLQAAIHFMEEKGLDEISGFTQLMIIPGYKFRIPNALITNFHMPKSTLLLLVSAFIGDDWKAAYDYALRNDFRFLSYGDSCLFFNFSDQNSLT